MMSHIDCPLFTSLGTLNPNACAPYFLSIGSVDVTDVIDVQFIQFGVDSFSFNALKIED